MTQPDPRLRLEGLPAAIDDQHRRMVALFRDMQAAAAVDPRAPVIDAQLQELLLVTEAHFREEESYMRNLPGGLAQFAPHLAQHQMLLFQLAKLRDEFSRGGTGISSSVLAFLERWLFDHMDTFDRELERFQRETSLVPAGEGPAPWLEPDT